MSKYIIFTLFFVSSVAQAEFDINQGFIYKDKNKKQTEETQTDEQKTPKVEVLRFYNESSKVSDPLADTEETAEIKFLKLKDKTLKEAKSNEEAQRVLASEKSVEMDLETIESALRHLEKQHGILSMPVVKFSEKDNFNTDQFLGRVVYLEKKLGVYKKEESNALSLSERIHKIKEASNQRATASE